MIITSAADVSREFVLGIERIFFGKERDLTRSAIELLGNSSKIVSNIFQAVEHQK
jgi:hypothetical protein